MAIWSAFCLSETHCTDSCQHCQKKLSQPPNNQTVRLRTAVMEAALSHGSTPSTLAQFIPEKVLVPKGPTVTSAMTDIEANHSSCSRLLKAEPVLTWIPSRRLDCVYRVQDAGATLLLFHPKPNSVIVSSLSRSKGSHSAP